MTADGRGSHSYNASGLVTQFTGPTVSAAYSYDPSGLRIAKTVNDITTYTVRSSGGSVLSEYRGACGTPVWSRDVLYAGGRLLESIKATTTEPTVALTPGTATVAEGAGSLTATITLTTATPLACPVTVHYQAVPGTASNGPDFDLAAGSITFSPGSATGATRTVSITILNDALDEADETFSVTLTGATGAQLSGIATAVVTITDDDPTPSLSVTDASLYEGQSGITSAVFTVTLSAASGRTVQASYASSNSSALAGSDYQAVSGTVTILPGLASVTISVPIFGDGAFEPNETFQLTLSSPANATLGDAYGLGTILNDDASRLTWGDFYAPRDGAADTALFNPATGLWAFKDSNTGTTTTFGPFGDSTSGDLFVPADYTGDGVTDCATYRPTGIWTIAPSCLPTGHYTVGWGGDPSDVPVPADYDGDGKVDLAVYRRAANWWYVAKSTGGSLAVELGWTWTYSIPVPGDYDGDGRADFAFYAEYNAAWVILYSSTGTGTMIEWGVPGATVIPVPADYDGDGRTDLAYYYPTNGTWHIVPSSTGVGQVTGFGGSEWTPVPADYDGDGTFDLAIYRASDRVFGIHRSSTGTTVWLGMGDSSPAGALPVLRKPQ